MTLFNDLGRLVNGFSLVAKEIAKRTAAIETARTGDVETLISSSLKKAIVSATDISGLTKGTVREFSSPRPKESVVYFDHSADAVESTSSQQQPQSSSYVGSAVDESSSAAIEVVRDVVSEAEKSGDAVVEEKITDSSVDNSLKLDEEGPVRERESDHLGNKVDDVRSEVVVAPQTRRRPRERKVPSTPFSRLVG